MARYTARPLPRSHSSVVSRWLVMPMATMSFAPMPAFCMAPRQHSTVVRQISSGSCSTSPSAGKCWRNSACAKAAIEVSVPNVSKAWGATWAVDDVSFEAAAASLLVLLGPSGCGKSTTLRLIAGLEQVTGGRILLGGIDVTGLPPAQRRIAMVFQSYALFPHLSVAENILFGLRVRKVPAAERARRLTRVAVLLGLDGLLQRKPSQLSGGQQQRVALGRAIIAETPVCLMDE